MQEHELILVERPSIQVSTDTITQLSEFAKLLVSDKLVCNPNQDEKSL